MSIEKAVPGDRSCSASTVLAHRLMSGEVFYILLVLALLAGVVLAVYPLARVTSRCQDVLTAINALRTVGVGTRKVSKDFLSFF